MDPDETLQTLRDLINGCPVWEDEAGEYGIEHFDEVFEKFQALDEWLSKGGFLPMAWQPKGLERH